MKTEIMAPTLLYAEDEMLIQQMLLEELETAGFTVLLASSGAQAIAILRKDFARIDCVITDINLGPGEEGWDVGRIARELNPAMPIIYASAVTTEEWMSRGVPASVKIAKPFVPAQVVVAMSSLLTASG